MKLQIGSVVTNRMLCQHFDNHAILVLRDYFEVVNRSRGRHAKVKITKEPPTADEYKKIKRKQYTKNLANQVEDAFSEFESLGGEMQDWFDSLPQQFQDGDKGSQLQDAQSTLEGISAPDVPDSLATLQVHHVPAIKCNSRSDRLYEACSILNSVISVLEDLQQFEWSSTNLLAEWPEWALGPKPILPIANLIELTEMLIEGTTDAADFMNELQEAISNAESVEFPGMFS